MLHFAASDLGLHYLPMSNKKNARLIWVNRKQTNRKKEIEVGAIYIGNNYILKIFIWDDTRWI